MDSFMKFIFYMERRPVTITKTSLSASIYCTAIFDESGRDNCHLAMLSKMQGCIFGLNWDIILLN
jgi:hypothetical protein